MQVSLEEIRRAGGYLEKEYMIDSENLDLDLSSDVHMLQSITVKAKFNDQNRNGKIVTKLKITVTAKCRCSRCLEIFINKLEGSFSGDYVPLEQKEFEDDQTVGCYGHDEVINLKNFIRESVIMLFPIKMICKETCRGICPQCGQNLNNGSCSCKKDVIDPRWAVLEKIHID